MLAIVELYAPAATVVAFTFDNDFTYRLNPDAGVASSRVTEVMVGTTAAGTVTVNVADDGEPICVPSLEYVVKATVIAPVGELGSSSATLTGIV